MTDRLATATGTLPTVREEDRGTRVRRFVDHRLRAGWSRLRSSVGRAALMAVCAVGAYWFAETVLGHQQPLFAATALLVALGFQREPTVRRVAEVAVGCTLGILIGDLLMLALGRGLGQAVLVLFVSVLVARFLDSGAIFATQMSLQSVLVVLLPLSTDGPFARSADAVVGGVVALLVTFLSPQDATRPAARTLTGLYESMGDVMRELSRGLREEESRTAWMALVQCRRTQTTLDTVRKELRVTEEQATLNPLQRSSRPAVELMATAADRSDLAVRSLRIVARRVVSILDHGAVDDDHREQLAAWFDEAADAVEILGRALTEPRADGRRRALDVARDALGAAASRLEPGQLAGRTVHGEALVMLLRPMMVDLMEATGASHAEATAHLPHV